MGRKLGPYTLEEVIGRGGMGVVYRARQPSTSRDVAVKVIGAAYARQAAFLRRFEQEAQAGARLQHPHILPVLDAGVAGGQPYLVTAYLPGGTLAARIAARPGGLPLDEAVRLSAQLAAALDYAHAAGVIHCDVKPGNVLLDAQGNAYLADFGIARLVNAANLAELPAPGTYPYTAPEVQQGQPATPASDVYALGMLVYEMLVGEPVAERKAGRPPDVTRRRPDVPRGIEVAVGQALHADPAARPPQAGSLAQALARAGGLPPLRIETPRPPVLDAPPRDARDQPTNPGAAAPAAASPPAPAPALIERLTKVHQPGVPREEPPRRLMWLVWGGLAISFLLLVAVVVLSLGGRLVF